MHIFRMILLFSLAFNSIPGFLIPAFSMPVRFEDLPKLIQERNQNVSGSQEFIHSAKTRTGYLARSFLPTLKLEGGTENFQTGVYRNLTQPYGAAELNINLFRGGRDGLEDDIRKAQLQTTIANSKTTVLTELTEARNTFWALVHNREMIETIRLALKQNEQSLQMANRRIQRGLATETDQLDFEIFRSQLEEELESLKHGELLIEMKLSAILGFNEKTEFETEKKILHIHDEPFLKTTFDPSTHPDIAVSNANEAISAYQRSQSNRWWMPSLDIYGGYYLYTLREREYLNEKLREDKVVGIKLTIDLYNAHSKSNANALDRQSQGYALQTLQQARSMKASVEIAKEDLKHDHELVHYAEDRIAQGNRYFKRTLNEYERGLKNSIDVLSAAQKFLGFERQYAERRRDYQLTKINLLALLGQ